MGTPKGASIFFSLLLLVTIYYLQSCTVIGYGLGNAIDSSSPDTLTIDPQDMHLLKTGTSIEIVLIKGDTITGVYQEMEIIAYEEYKQMYQKKMVFNNEKWPQLQDSIQITYRRSGSIRKGTFVGFAPGQLFLQMHTATYPSNLDYLKQIEFNTFEMDPTKVDSLILANDVPSRITVHVKKDTTKLNIPLDDIALTYRPVEKFGERIGMLLGLSVDVLLLSAIQSGWSPISYVGNFNFY